MYINVIQWCWYNQHSHDKKDFLLIRQYLGMTGFQLRFLEYDTCINLLILKIECIILSCCFQVGLRIFIFYHWSKMAEMVTTQDKKTNQPRRNVQIKQTQAN